MGTSGLVAVPHATAAPIVNLVQNGSFERPGFTAPLDRLVASARPTPITPSSDALASFRVAGITDLGGGSGLSHRDGFSPTPGITAVPPHGSTKTNNIASVTGSGAAGPTASAIEATPKVSTLADLSEPQTAIDIGPIDGGVTVLRDHHFHWTGTDETTPTAALQYSYSLDGAPASPFDTVTVLLANGLAEGAHSLSVTARDTAGNLDATPATRSFTVWGTPGDVIVLDQTARKLTRVEPNSGNQTVLSQANGTLSPSHVIQSPTGELYVMDHRDTVGTSQPGAVYRMNPVTGAMTTVSSGGLLVDPIGGAFDSNSDLLVADLAAVTAAGAIVRISSLSGAQSVVSSGGSFSNPVDVAVDASGMLYVADFSALGGSGAIFRVDPGTGAQTLLTSGGNFVAPTGPIELEFAPDGSLLALSYQAGRVVRVNPVTGVQTLVASGGYLVHPMGLGIASNGDLLVADSDAFGGSGGVIRIDPVSGEQRVAFIGVGFIDPTGLAIVPGPQPVLASISIASGLVLKGAHSFDSITVANGGQLTVAGTTSVMGNMIVQSGGVVTHALRDTAGLVLNVTGTLDVQSGGAIDVSGRGLRGGGTASDLLGGSSFGANGESFDPTTGSIVSGAGFVSTSGAGGSHAGLGGGAGNGAVSGGAYGSAELAQLLGAGGGGSGFARGGAGGGRVKIVASSMIVNGQVLANGGSGSSNIGTGTGGAGSGGSLRIEVGSLSGAGQVQANGGTAVAPTNQAAGSGGGGRIALRYGTLTLPAANIIARGAGGPAVPGAAGTVFLQDSTLATGDLIVENGSVSSAQVTPLAQQLGSFKDVKLSAFAKVRTDVGPVGAQGTIAIAPTALLQVGAGLRRITGPVQLTGGTIAASDTITLASTLSGTGFVAAPLKNAGLLSPGAPFGRIVLNNGYTDSAGVGQVKLEVGGTNSGVDLDDLRAIGTARLGGGLQVDLANGFNPSPDQTFEPMHWTARTDTFTTVTGSAAGLLAAAYTDTTLRLISLNDTSVPQTAIDIGPIDGGVTVFRDHRFHWTGSDESTPTAALQFSYSLDGAPASTFDTVTVLLANDLAEGAHSLSVTARDAAGNLDATPATRSFTVWGTPGDILSADFTANTINRVDPNSGNQTAVYHANGMVAPAHVVIAPTGEIYVTDFGNNATVALVGAVHRINPVTGATTVITSGNTPGNVLADPFGAAFDSRGDLIVADGSAVTVAGAVVRVNVASGAQSVVSSGGSFVNPFDVAIDSTGTLFVTDYSAQAGVGAIFRVNPVTGAQALLTSGGNFQAPVGPTGVVFLPDGSLAVTSFSAARIVRVNPTTGAQSVISSGGYLVNPVRLAVASNGDLLVGDREAFGGSGAIIRIDVATGTQKVAFRGGSFVDPDGIAIIPGTQPVTTSFTVRNGMALPGTSAFDRVIVASSGQLTIDGTVTAGDLHVQPGGLVTHSARNLAGLHLNVTDSLVVQAAGATLGRISASSVGLLGGLANRQPGEAYDPTTGVIGRITPEVAGGSHGGLGGAQFSPLYDDEQSPAQLGAGGGAGATASGQPGGNGGGAIFIDAGTLIVDGSIDANGANAPGPSSGGGGAGGTIALSVGTITGAGPITALGGNAGNGVGSGGGGGGRIAVRYNSATYSFTGSYAARGGGEFGGGVIAGLTGSAGSIFLKDNERTAGDLYFDNNGLGGSNNVGVTLLGSGGARTFKSITVRNQGWLVLSGAISPVTVQDSVRVGSAGHLHLAAGASLSSPVTSVTGASADLTNLTSWTLGSAAGLQVSNGGKVTNQASGTLTLPQLDHRNIPSGTIASSGRLDIGSRLVDLPTGSRLELLAGSNLNGDSTLTRGIVAGTMVADIPLRSSDLTVRSGGRVEHSVRNLGGLRLTVSDSLVLDGGANPGRLAASGAGLLGGLGNRQPGEAYNPVTGVIGRITPEVSGGSHGGLGGAQLSPVYDDEQSPVQLGAGGGAGAQGSGQGGGNGGGAILVQAGTLMLEGVIEANGANAPGPSSGGGGAGGSVAITADVVRGAGSVLSFGGNAGNGVGSGGGGGGRIAVRFNGGTYSFTGAFVARGGGEFGGGVIAGLTGAAGTIFLKDNAQAAGDLYLDNNGLGGSNNSNVTLLTSLGARSFRTVQVRNHGRLTISATTSPFTVSDSVRVSGTGHMRIDSGASLVSPVISVAGASDLTNFAAWTVPTAVALQASGSSQLLNEASGTLVLPRLDPRNLPSATLTNRGRLDVATSLVDLPSGSRLELLAGSNLNGDNTLTRAIVGGTWVNDIPVALGDLTVNSGGRIEHTRRQLSGLRLTVADSSVVNGLIDVSTVGLLGAPGGSDRLGEGYNPTTLAIVKVTPEVNGASHGGHGGGGSGPSEAYGDPTIPTLLGAGGGGGAQSSGQPGGHGGGALQLRTNTLVLNGMIAANGQNGPGPSSGGGGAGGSISIETDRWSGSAAGVITAIGGNAGFGIGSGGGSGGRIAVRYRLRDYLGALTSRGGTAQGFAFSSAGAAGTIFQKDSLAAAGDLLVDNGDLAHPYFTGVATPLDHFRDITVTRAARLRNDAGPIGAQGTITVNTNSRVQVGFGTRRITGPVRLNGGLVFSPDSLMLASTLSGTGWVNGLLKNIGVVSPGAPFGRIILNNGYADSAGVGQVKLEIGGTNSGVDADDLRAIGTARLGGALQLDLTNGFNPSPGQTFTPMHWAARTDTFTTVTGSASGVLATTYTDTTLRVVGLNDITSPQTVIDVGPAQNSNATAPTIVFHWTGTDDISLSSQLRFSYSFDGSAATPFDTVTVLVLPSLAPGSHTLSVTARDAAGNTDPTPATRTFNYLLPTPTAGASATLGPLTFNWTVTPAAANAYRLDIARGLPSPDSIVASIPVGNVLTYTYNDPTRDGATYYGRISASVDGGANYLGSSGFSGGTFVDRQPPTVSITSGPAAGGFVNTASVTFTFTASDGSGSGISGYSYRLDGAAYTPYGPATTANFTGLVEGPHQFDVRARDNLGNETVQTCTFNTSGLVSWWPGEGSAADVWGTNSGTLQNGVTFAPGKVGQAYSFDGLDDQIAVPSAASLNVGTGDFTVDLWAQFHDLATDSNGLISKDDYAGTSSYQGWLFNICDACTPAGVGFQTRQSVNGVGPATYARWSTSNFQTGQWYHLAGVRRAGTLELYVDGVLRSVSVEASPTDVSSSQSLTLGALSAAAPQFFDGLLDDATFTARALSASELAAIHAAGGRQPCTGAASRTFAVDLTVPETQIVAGPAEGAVITSSSAIFTVGGTDTQTPTPQLQYSWSLDGGAFSAFSANTAITVPNLTDAAHTFAVRARDLAGNLDPTPATRSFIVHAAAPVVSIVTAPAAVSSLTSGEFRFTATSSWPADSILCAFRFDTTAFSPFDTVRTAAYTNFAEGVHTLNIQARDPGGLVGTLARTFTIDVTPPQTTVATGPAEGAHTNAEPVVFTFTGTDNLSATNLLQYSWRLNDGSLSTPAATTTATLPALAEGPHTFEVHALDVAGNADASPAARSFTVDRTSPETQIVSGPPDSAVVAVNSLAYGWTGTDDRTTAGSIRFEYRLDAAAFGNLSTATLGTLTNVADGAHTFAVRALDLAGNPDPSPATRHVVVDALPPVVTIVAGPAPNACVAADTIVFAFTATDVVSPRATLQFSWSVDGGTPTPFGPDTTALATGLADGLHTFTVQASDERSHVGTTTRGFRVDRQPAVAFTPTAVVLDASRVRFTCTGIDNSGITGYHLQVSTDLSFATVAQEVDLSPAGIFDFTGVPGDTYYARSRASDCAGNPGAYSEPSNNGTLANLANLVVAQVLAPPTAIANQVVHVEFTVANDAIGATNVPQWLDDVYLTPGTTFVPATAIFLGRVQNLTYLAPGESYTIRRDFLIPVGVSGTWHVMVIADAVGQVPETRGDDNLLASPLVDVSLGAVADLEVTQVTAPPTALSSGGATMVWTVTNVGDGRTPVDRWFDTVFYSTDKNFDFAVLGGGNTRVLDFPVGNLEHVGALEPGQSYTVTATVPVPGNASGDKWFMVASDLRATAVNQSVPDRGAVFENLHELNTRVADSTSITLVPPPDLAVDTLLVDPSLSPTSGGPLTVRWAVHNRGFSDAVPQPWTDRVWLSTNASLDAGDLLLADFGHGGGLALDQFYVMQRTLTIPNGVAGARWVIVATDVFNELGEFNEGNNARVTATPISIALSPWPNLRPIAGSASDTVGAGQQAQLRWTVANQSPNNRSVSQGWRDDVYLSPSPTWNPGSARLLAAPRTGQTLAPGQSYIGAATIGVPTDFAGTYYVYVVTDALNEVYEHSDEADNLQRVASLYVRPYPPVDVAISNVGLSATAVSTGQVLSFGWTLQNIGQAATLASSWPEQVWLSADTVLSPGSDILFGTFTHGGALLAGTSAGGGAGIGIPPGLAGTFHALVRTDPNLSTGDFNPANNVAASAATVTITNVPVVLQPSPNVTLTSMTAVGSVNAGQPLHIDVGLQNLGPGSIVSRNWSVSAYLSTDTRLDGGDIPLGSVAGPTTFAALETAARVLDVNVPGFAAGPYFLILQADSRNEIGETNESDNGSLRPLFVVLPAPADLIVRDITFGAPAVTPGLPIVVSYTLENVGVNAAVGQLHNAVYLSADTTFDSAVDPLVGLDVANINLAPGEVANLKQRVSFAPLPLASQPGGVGGVTPPLTPGPYHGIVRANVRASIRESVSENNATTSVGTVQGEVPALTLDVPTLFTTALNELRFFKVLVPAGQDLTLSMGSDVSAATHEMFVKFGATPTGSEFDFSGPPEFTARPSVLVPGTQAGEYFIMIAARGLGTQASIAHDSITARLLPFQITSHLPAAGGAGGRVTGRIRGAGLRDTTVLTLEQGGDLKATGRLVRYTNSTDVRVRWDLSHVPLGDYDIVATNGAERVVLPGAFHVEAPQPAAVAIETDRADVMRRNAIAPFTFTFRNTSNQDVQVVRGRVLYPAGSSLRNVVTSPDLLSRSERMPALFQPVVDDAYAVYHPSTGDSLAVIDLIGTNLSPGEGRSVTVSVSGFATSPYSVLAMSGEATLIELLERESGYAERGRLALLTNPGTASAALMALATDGQAFRAEHLRSSLQEPGLVSATEIDDYLGGLPSGLPIDVSDYPSEGPEGLLAEAAAGECIVPSAVPDCVPDLAPTACALPGCVVVFDTALPLALPAAGGAVAAVPSALTRGFTVFDCADTKIVAPCDPNLITGPAGFGNEHWVKAGNVLNYKVDFENLSGVAAAPAQVVRVTVPLDAGLDFASFRLGNAGFNGDNGKVIGVPLNRSAFDNGGIFYDDLNLYVQFTAGIDPNSGVATFTFSTLGLDRQPPSNATAGFLPVNDATGRGQGYVTFTVKARTDGALGDTVEASASIRFDQNAPVNTNVISNRVDKQTPSSAVIQAIPSADSTHLRISWVGNDESAGSGLKGYTVFLKRDTGGYTNVGSLLASNAMDLNVEIGHTYSLYTRATDNVDNTEPDKSAPDQIIEIGTLLLGTGDPQLPRVTLLHQNAPNPWRGSTLIRFDLATESEVILEVFDVQGRVVARPLDRKRMRPGHHSVPIERINGGPGVYFYRMSAKAFSGTKRMVRMR